MTVTQRLTRTPRAIAPDPHSTHARLLYLLPALMILVPVPVLVLVLVLPLALVLLRLATGIHHIAIPTPILIVLNGIPIETPRAQILQSSFPSASIQRAVCSPKRKILPSRE